MTSSMFGDFSGVNGAWLIVAIFVGCFSASWDFLLVFCETRAKFINLSLTALCQKQLHERSQNDHFAIRPPPPTPWLHCVFQYIGD